MRKYKLTRYLAMLFIAVVIIPAVVLSLLAIRAISHEEAYIEKQLEGTLLAEVAHATALINTEVARIMSELAGTVPVASGTDAGDSLDMWTRRSALVDIPFLLSPEHEILWPAARQRTGTRESTFAEKQQAFFSGEVDVPVYENIAVAYKDEILGDVDEPVATAEDTPLVASLDKDLSDGQDGLLRAGSGGATDEPVIVASNEMTASAEEGGRRSVMPRPETEESPSEVMTDIRSFAGSPGENPDLADSKEIAEMVRASGMAKKSASLDAVAPVGSERTGKGAEEAKSEMPDRDQVPPIAQAEERPVYSEHSRSKQAISEFEQREPVRKKVYEEAEKRGQQVSYRNIAPPAKQEDMERVPGEVDALKSMFVSESLNFSEIIARDRSGFIPRMIDERMRLLYWQKLPGGNIVGCLIDSEQLRERIIGVLPGIYSQVRILTVLDENSNPLIVPQGHGQRDWRKPFVAQEISELLPHWEVVAYLTNPDVISSRAQVASSVMWILILILFVSLVSGGAIVLRSAYAEVKLAQQKTSFVANVSHELKTPLTSIRMFAEMLRDGRQPDESKRKRYLDIMTSETERLTRLINNVLDFSRMGQGKKHYTVRVCDAVALCEDVVENQRARLENNGFDVTFTAPRDQVFVRADDESVKQAVVNLLSNAEKYSAEIKQIDVNITCETGSVLIAVSDRGVGIPPGEGEKIFTEFYRVDDALSSRARGTGLGLTIARRILRDHNGDIRYRPRDGGGSTFEIVLPLVEEQL
ncbi:MAG: HAMP domain-containing sensor histidine kinase [Candidatus Eisenbacteria bacterium]